MVHLLKYVQKQRLPFPLRSRGDFPIEHLKTRDNCAGVSNNVQNQSRSTKAKKRNKSEKMKCVLILHTPVAKEDIYSTEE